MSVEPEDPTAQLTIKPAPNPLGKKTSKVWDYFGQLFKGNTIIKEEFIHCKECLKEKITIAW